MASHLFGWEGAPSYPVPSCIRAVFVRTAVVFKLCGPWSPWTYAESDPGWEDVGFHCVSESCVQDCPLFRGGKLSCTSCWAG